MGYLERALIAIALIGALTGFAGVFIVLRKRVLFAQALTHATFPGAIIAAVLGVNMQWGALLACLSLAAILTALSKLHGQGTQAASGVMLTAGFAFGVVLQALNPDIPVQLDSFLFGSILSVTWTDATIAAVALAIVLVIVAAWGKQLVFFLFDGEAYSATGHKPWVMEGLILLITVVAVVAALPAAGAILSIALIAAPAAAARYFSDKLAVLLWLAPALGIFSGVTGLLLSRWLGLSAGASISLTAALIFVIAWSTYSLRRPLPQGALV